MNIVRTFRGRDWELTIDEDQLANLVFSENYFAFQGSKGDARKIAQAMLQGIALLFEGK